MCSERLGFAHSPAMTIRPGGYIMNGGASSGSEDRENKPHVNGVRTSVEESKRESQRIVEEMLAQKREAFTQVGEAMAASSTSPQGGQFRAGLGGGVMQKEGNGTLGGGVAEESQTGGSEEDDGRQQLVRLVEELKGMDELACFIEPVDDSFAPGYSKIILRPMSFSVMLTKAKNGEYPLVKDLLEDLELICYNAMKYNAKRSKIYNAASLLLKRGKKHVRAFIATHRPEELERRCDKRALPSEPAPKIKTRRELAKKVEEKGEAVKPKVKHTDVDVVGGGADRAALRVDRYDGSTDCSSSYAETASDSEEEWGYNPEISSKFRGDDRDAEGREKRTLNPEWKKQRRGIEWRARWLEVRMVDIQQKADRYDHLARQLKTRQQTHALHPTAQKGSPEPPPKDQALPPKASLPASTPSQPPILSPTLPSGPQVATLPESINSHPAEPSGVFNSSGNPPPEVPEGSGSAPPGIPKSSEKASPGVPNDTGNFLQAPQAPAVALSAHPVVPSTQRSDAAPPPGSLPEAPAVEASQQLAPPPAAAELPAVSAPPRQVSSTAARVDLEAVQLPAGNGSKEPGGGAQLGDTLVGRVKQSLRHHRKRKKPEVESMTEAAVAAHPLLSRYDKASRKRPRMPGDDTISMADVDLRSMSPGVEAPPERTPRLYPPPLPVVFEDEPMDCLMEKIEVLQQRLHTLRSQLHYSAANRPPPRRLPVQTPRPLGQNPLPTPRPITTPRPSPTPSPRNAPSPSPGGRSMLSPSPSGSPKADLERTRSANLALGGGAMQRSGSGAALMPGRRRTADYDISNVVSSVSVGRKTVEQLQHTKIETPRWRLVQQTFDQLVGGDSSEEDTDDESYARRHAPLEAQEKLRYMPPPSKHQGMGKPTGKGKEKPPSARGKPPPDGHTDPMSPRSPAYKRRKAHGGKGENGVAKGKAKGGGLPPPGAKGKAPAVKTAPLDAASADGSSEGGAKDGGEASVAQDENQKRRASPGLTIEIPEIH